MVPLEGAPLFLPEAPQRPKGRSPTEFHSINAVHERVQEIELNEEVHCRRLPSQRHLESPQPFGV